MRYFVPGMCFAGEDVGDPFSGGGFSIFFDCLGVFCFDFLAEDGVGEAGAVADAGEEGDVAFDGFSRVKYLICVESLIFGVWVWDWGGKCSKLTLHQDQPVAKLKPTYPTLQSEPHT